MNKNTIESKVKGVVIIGAEVVCVAVIIATESLRINYINLANTTTDQAARNTYIQNANKMQTKRNIAIGGAAAVYFYNLIDAAVAKGAKRIVPNQHFSLVPYLDNSYTGLSFSYNF